VKERVALAELVAGWPVYIVIASSIVLPLTR
jgi:hypothetical protein